MLATVPDPGEAAHQLVELANEHGGSDNITVIVVDVLVGEDAPATPRSSRPSGTVPGLPCWSCRPRVPGPAGRRARADVVGQGRPAGLRAAQTPVSDAATAVADTGTASSFWTTRRRCRWPGRPTVRSAATASPALTPPAPPDESRRARRRRLGIQRRITFRVVLFILLVAAIPVGAFFAIRWYAYDNWFLASRTTRSW